MVNLLHAAKLAHSDLSFPPFEIITAQVPTSHVNKNSTLGNSNVLLEKLRWSS